MKVLVVEDQKFLAEVTVGILRDMYDHDVAHASTAATAVEIASRQPFDLVLIDLNLPDSSGYELAARLRKINAMDRTVFVALTGIGNSVDPEQVRASGIDAYFTKPMDFELLETIERQPN